MTGGDSGGHIYPLISVAEQLKIISDQKRIPMEIIYLGCPGNFEFVLVSNGVRISKLISAKRRRYSDIRNIFTLPRLLLGIIQAFWKVFWIMPDVLFSKGGTGSVPVVLACKFYRIPIIIHESDSIAGFSNLFSSKYADRIAIGFEKTAESFADHYEKEQDKGDVLAKIALVGNPIRNFLLKEGDINRQVAKKIFEFNPEKPLILVLGGSQGAMRINDFFVNIGKELVSGGLQILLQTGINNFDEIKSEWKLTADTLPDDLKFAFRIAAYFNDDIKDAYAAADLIVSRAGSGSIFEVAAAGKPAILLPLSKEIAGEHQIKNAYEYADKGAAIVIEDENLKPHLFIDQINRLFQNPELLKLMSLAAKNFSKPQAAQTIAEEIIRLGNL